MFQPLRSSSHIKSSSNDGGSSSGSTNRSNSNLGDTAATASSPSSSATATNGSSTLLSLSDLRRRAAERGLERSHLASELQRESKLKQRMKLHSSLLLVSDTIRSVYVGSSTPRSSLPLGSLLDAIVPDLRTKFSKKELREMIALLTQHVPEFFQLIPADTVCPEPVLRLNFHADYAAVRSCLRSLAVRCRSLSNVGQQPGDTEVST